MEKCEITSANDSKNTPASAFTKNWKYQRTFCGASGIIAWCYSQIKFLSSA